MQKRLHNLDCVFYVGVTADEHSTLLIKVTVKQAEIFDRGVGLRRYTIPFNPHSHRVCFYSDVFVLF